MNKNKIVSIFLTVLLTTTSSVTAFAAENKTSTDVSSQVQAENVKNTKDLKPDNPNNKELFSNNSQGKDNIQKESSQAMDISNSQLSKSSTTAYSSKKDAKSVQLNSNNVFSIKKEDNSSTMWSKFTISNDGLVTINLDKILVENNREENLYLVLENESGSQKYLDINPFYNGALSSNGKKSWSVGLKSGTYYLKLESGFYAKSQINVNFNISYIKDNFYEKELNDNLKSATIMDSSETYKGVMYSYDTDYFVFKNTESNFSVNLKQTNPNCKYSVVLCNSDGNDIYPSNAEYNNENKTTKFNFNNIGSGDVYIKITLNDNSHYYQDFYELSLNKLSCGWVQENGKWYYYENGKKKTGLLVYDNKKYLLGDDGARLTGWQTFNNNWYYFDSKSGAATSGWMNIENNWYYFNNSFEMQTGLQKIDGFLYYFSDNGVMNKGWLKVNDFWYYFNPESGAGKIGWFNENGYWYYFNDSSQMVTGLGSIDNYAYYFGDNGVMKTGWVVDSSGNWRYFTENGAMKTGWFSQYGSWYFLRTDNGVMLNSIWRIDGVGYYFNSSGIMQTGWQRFGNAWRYFNPSGNMQVGWFYTNGNWYYFNKEGIMIVGFYFVDGKFYYFDSNGKLVF